MFDETVGGHAMTKRQQAAARQTLRRVRGARGRARSWEREALNVQGSTLNVQRSTFNAQRLSSWARVGWNGGQTRYFAELGAGGLIKPDESGRRSQPHFGNKADIDFPNVC